MPPKTEISPYPSVDYVVRLREIQPLVERHGRHAVVDAIRAVLDRHRSRPDKRADPRPSDMQVASETVEYLRSRTTPSLRRAFNLTGIVLHTNLGRALLSDAAVNHVSMVMREPCTLELDLDEGKRGDRDTAIERVLTELTGSEAATVVNNNAAAVLLVLAALATDREVILSRGELIEIGGSFRIPDVMRSANARLVEVGTTNRTHPSDYESAIGPHTAALMKVHASNYRITGFVAEVGDRDVAAIAHARGLPLVVDLGAGSLVDLTRYGLPKEPIVRDAIASGADVVTFSGDKLLGGPQAGLIVGKRSLMDRIKRHPLKRALRVGKLTMAALETTLVAYHTPDRLDHELPTLRMLTRTQAQIHALAVRLQPSVAVALGSGWTVTVTPVASQVGNGSLPMDTIPSAALEIRCTDASLGAALSVLAGRFRRLPVPIIGRIANGRLLLDLRCLEDEAGFLEQIECLARSRARPAPPAAD